MPGAKRKPVRDEAQPRGEFAYCQLRTEIEERYFRPGDRLREAELAKRFGVSRTPIREAMKRLESEGLIIFASPRGFVVTELSQSQVMELYAMREVLEGAAARFAAEHASSIEIQLMSTIIEQQANLKKPEDFAISNRRLHAAISGAAHNSYLLKANVVLQDALALLGTTTYSVAGRMQAGAREHEELVKAIENRNPDTAEALARRHIRLASAARMSMLFGR
jgi:DNA-binding GntR family transcriptional regulator